MVSSRSWSIAIIGLFLVAGAIVGASGDTSGELEVAVSGVGAWPLYVLTYLWIKADARERGITPPPGAVALVVPLFALSAPYYLLASRPRWQKLTSLALFVGFVVVVAGAYWAGSIFGSALVT
jgi:apolipoprotein N-acyltransferase